MKYLTREAFTKKYAPFVINLTRGTGIFPEVLISQAIIESQGSYNGQMLVGASKLAAVYNNFFGIKAGKNWTGPTVNLKTGEVINNKEITITDRFRVYNSPEDSFRDYIRFLKSNPRYTKAGVFSADNYQDQIIKIAAAGYATNPNYADMVEQVARGIKPFIEERGTYLAAIAAGLIIFFLIEKHI